MLVMQLSFVSGMAIGMAVVVAMTLLASLTLLRPCSASPVNGSS